MRTAYTTLALLLVATAVYADPLNCDLTAYKAAPGLTAAVGDEALTLTWEGDRNQEVRLRLAISGGTPTIRELAVRRNGQWATVASNVTPDFRVVSGIRRVTNQQLQPLRQLKVDITPEIIDQIKWDAFWDAPLHVPGTEPGRAQNNPGLPRKPEEIKRANATYRAQGCTVKTNGARIEVTFPGVQLGVFSGQLQYTVYKGTNLIEQEIIAKTDEPSVAYKYDAGLKGLAIQPATRIVWRDTSNLWQDYRLGGEVNKGPAILQASNRLVIAEGPSGSIAVFPPPHRFFWSREIEFNLGYNFYQKDSASSFSFGIRQADSEGDPHRMGRGEEDYRQNFALYSARPGTWQRMPVYLYVSAEPALATAESALAFTRQDRYKPLPGYQVMATHFHTSFVERLRGMGGLDAKLPDLMAIKATGINIFAPIDGGAPQPFATGGPGGGAGRGRGAGPGNAEAAEEARLEGLAAYYEAARIHSDRNFLVMPNEEGNAAGLGGHNDLLISKPLYWIEERKPGQPLVQDHPKYGRVYHVGSPADWMEMAQRENALVFMPHPRSKGSTGFPDAIKDTAHFRHDNYRGIGVRWGMGVDGSETRLCEYRCQVLLDDMNNWVADLPGPPKFINAISETYAKAPGDDIYASNPVNYVKLASLPGATDWSPIIDAMKRGDYFWTSGEVLIPSYSVQGTGNQRTIVADVEWTFPLDFVEVVWGDGQKTDRQIIPATDLPAFGKQQFRIPFDATGKKWVRFAAWDTAHNGAMVQPIKLSAR
jgi:hypothetical protein